MIKPISNDINNLLLCGSSPHDLGNFEGAKLAFTLAGFLRQLLSPCKPNAVAPFDGHV